jgi:hypothetical protein
VNLEGPKTLTKMDCLVPNEYDFTMKLFNKKNSKEQKTKVKVIQEPILDGSNISPQKITPQSGKTYKISDFMNLSGDIVNMRVYDEDEMDQIQILSPLNKGETHEFSLEENIVSIKGNVILSKIKG